MAAVSAMIPGWLLHGDLPPTGNRIVLSSDGQPPPQFLGYQAQWVQSGTAALALALIIARNARPDIHAPTVLLPAYGCPDLVAAAEFAGVQPVLVDIGADDPGFNLDQLAQALDASTVAVVAVNFLGIRERLSDIRTLLQPHPGVLLIEDNAQWFPEPADGSTLQGDLVCLSFGRGKPVSLLGGGALLIREKLVTQVPYVVGDAEEPGISLPIKTRLLNALLHSRLYPLVNRNPLIELGQTYFKPLHEIRTLDSIRLCSLASATDRYLAHSRDIETAWLRAVSRLTMLDGISVASDRIGRLLRFPVLCRDANVRDELLRELSKAGLGATAMYQHILPEVAGVNGKVRVFGDLAGARNFAARLLTLPVHERVTSAHVECGVNIMSSRQL